jgi:hypothetical protein
MKTEGGRNSSLFAYVEDSGEPGAGADRFWSEVKDKDGSLDRSSSNSSGAPQGRYRRLSWRP